MGAYSSAVTWTATGGTITTAGVFTPSGVGKASCTANSAQTGFTKVSGSAPITVTAPPSISSVRPAAGLAGQSIAVTITGLNTNFASGVTTASFGAGISVGGAPEGSAGPVAVNSPTTITAQISIDPSGSSGDRAVTVGTGTQEASQLSGFDVVTEQTGATGTGGDFSFSSFTVQAVDVASQLPLPNIKVALLNDGASQGLIATDPSGNYAPEIGLLASGPTLSSIVARAAEGKRPSDPNMGGPEAQTQATLQLPMTSLSSLGTLGPLGIAQAAASLTGAMWQSLVNQCESACAQDSASCEKNVTLSDLRSQILTSLGANEAQEFAQAGYFYLLDSAFPDSATALGGVDEAFSVVTAAPAAIDNTLTVLEEIEGINYQLEGYQWTSTFNACEEIPQYLNVPLVGLGSFLVMYPLEAPNGTVSTTVSGVVKDATTGNGVSGATVDVGPGGGYDFSEVTSSNGTFSGSVVGVPGEDYTIMVEAPGYVTGFSQFTITQNNQPVSTAIYLAPYSSTQPVIQSVTPIVAAAAQGIIISGTGFGTGPQTTTLSDGSVETLACNVTTPSLAINDSGSGSDSWSAGRNTCANSDLIGIDLVSWSNTQIVLNGFGTALGNASKPATWNIAPGDPITVNLSGANQSGTATYNLQVSPATPVTPAGATTVAVQSNQAWTDTGVNLSVGATVTVSATGFVVLTTDGHIPPMSPAGFPPNCTAGEVYGQLNLSAFPNQQLPCWSLIGQIGSGGTIFEVGTNYTFQAQTAGELYLGINDNNLPDNSGNWTTVINVTQ